MTLWAEESVIQLRKLRQAGCSAAECARSLGMTRNQVIGKLSRLGILARPTIPIQHNNCTDRTKHNNGGVTTTVRKTFPTKPMPVTGAQDDYSIPVAQRLSIFDLSDATCRWPVGDPRSADFFFCGAVTGGHVYCKLHARRALPQAATAALATMPSSASWASR